MTDVKRLLDEATPLPWRVRDAINERGRIEAVLVAAPTDVRRDGIVADTGEFPDRQAKPDARLIEHAVNHLPDYEAAVDALAAVAWNQSDGPCWCDHNIGGTEVTKHGDRCQKASTALRRLRGDA